MSGQTLYIYYKKCMPDGINSKVEHEGYLKTIGYEKYVKALQNVSSLVECWWLLYCLSAVIGCPSLGMIINNLK